jgi:alanine racemase
MPPVSTLEVDLGAMRHNVRRLRACASPSTRVCAAVKADAYGLGAVPVSRALRDLVDMFAVFTVPEAMELIDTLHDLPPILVLMPVQELPPEARHAAQQLHFVIHDLDQMRHLRRSTDAKLNLHVQIDTGMSRGGCDPQEFPAIVRSIGEDPTARLVGVLTHLASANADAGFTRLQHQRFRTAVDGCREILPKECLLHVGNTFGLLQSQDYHESMIRPGIGLLGYGSEQMTTGSLLPPDELRPALRWSSRIVQIKSIPTGTGVGYNLTWFARRSSTIGLIPAGYADGYPTQSDRTLPGQRSVAVLLERGSGVERVFVPVIGSVNMDQINVDLTDLPAPARVGTEVELITPDPTAPNHGPTLARLSRISAYELATGIGRRVQRVYLRE